MPGLTIFRTELILFPLCRGRIYEMMAGREEAKVKITLQ
jgi:hypothetical protein